MLRLFRRQPAPEETRAFVDVVHDGRPYRVTIKRVAQARRFTLKVRSATGDAVLTMPTRGTLKAARSFAQRHAAWVGDRLEALPARIPLTVGSTVPLRGRDCPILPSTGLRATAFLDEERGPDGIVATVIRVSGSAKEQQRRVLALLQGEARRDLQAAVTRHAATVCRRVRSITLRDTRSRWGSCTASGALNFSWRLIMAPAFVLDYLAAHEVAHLVHLDHSPAYWAVARRLAPDLEEAERWLRLHGASLHRFDGSSGR